MFKVFLNPETPETGSCEAGYFVPDDGKPHGNINQKGFVMTETRTIKKKGVCYICGHEDTWFHKDKERGFVLDCDMCGKVFCGKCFAKNIGKDEHEKMMRGTDKILCPGCYRKYHGYNLHSDY